MTKKKKTSLKLLMTAANGVICTIKKIRSDIDDKIDKQRRDSLKDFRLNH